MYNRTVIETSIVCKSYCRIKGFARQSRIGIIIHHRIGHYQFFRRTQHNDSGSVRCDIILDHAIADMQCAIFVQHTTPGLDSRRTGRRISVDDMKSVKNGFSVVRHSHHMIKVTTGQRTVEHRTEIYRITHRFGDIAPCRDKRLSGNRRAFRTSQFGIETAIQGNASPQNDRRSATVTTDGFPYRIYRPLLHPYLTRATGIFGIRESRQIFDSRVPRYNRRLPRLARKVRIDRRVDKNNQFLYTVIFYDAILQRRTIGSESS